MRRMEILGLSESTPRTESRLKSLFWPSIQSGADVDYLGAQGYWVCTIIAVLSLLFGTLTGHWLSAIITCLFFYFGGVGVRERNLFAALLLLTAYFFETFVVGIGVIRILFLALLISNVRATWICSAWSPGSDEESSLPPRFSDTWSDWFADKLPSVLWPKIKIVYFVYAVIYLLFTVVGVAAILGLRIAGRSDLLR